MCAPLMPMQPPSQPKGLRLYCFEFYTSNTGTTKKNTELDLIRTQLHVGASIFGCKGWDVYSDTKVWISPGPPELFTTEVAIPADAYFAKRKIQGTWVNSMIYYEVWKTMRNDGGCKGWDVYSDTKTWISPGPPEIFTTEVAIPADAYFAKRKIQGTWVNSLIFVEVWKKMQEEGEYKDYDWVVKADADAVFLPARLLDTLKTQPVTD